MSENAARKKVLQSLEITGSTDKPEEADAWCKSTAKKLKLDALDVEIKAVGAKTDMGPMHEKVA